MTHIWLRAEQRPNEERVGLTPEGSARLLAAGYGVTVEESSVRAIGTQGFRAAGCTIAPENSWPDAPPEAIIFGLKELPEDGTPLRHRHILFGHGYKGQPAGQRCCAVSRPGAACFTTSNIWWTRPDGASPLLAIGRGMPGPP